MRRGSWVKGGLLLILLLLLVGGGLAWAVKREPDFYAQAMAAAPTAADPKLASETQTRVGELVTAINVPYAVPGDWEVRFTADELNAFLRDDTDHVLLLRPKVDGWTNERVAIQGDRLLVGARRGTGATSVVMSVELRAWLVGGEPNTFAVELIAVRAGVLPLPKRWVMDLLSEYAVDHNAEVTWYRGAGNPVAVCRLRVNQPQPDLALTTLEIADGRIVVGGKGLIGQ